jgi:hypothetical protein
MGPLDVKGEGDSVPQANADVNPVATVVVVVAGAWVTGGTVDVVEEEVIAEVEEALT